MSPDERANPAITSETSTQVGRGLAKVLKSPNKKVTHSGLPVDELKGRRGTAETWSDEAAAFNDGEFLSCLGCRLCRVRFGEFDSGRALLLLGERRRRGAEQFAFRRLIVNEAVLGTVPAD